MNTILFIGSCQLALDRYIKNILRHSQVYIAQISRERDGGTITSKYLGRNQIFRIAPLYYDVLELIAEDCSKLLNGKLHNAATVNKLERESKKLTMKKRFTEEPSYEISLPVPVEESGWVTRNNWLQSYIDGGNFKVFVYNKVCNVSWRFGNQAEYVPKYKWAGRWLDCIYVELNGFIIHTTTDINLHVYNKICHYQLVIKIYNKNKILHISKIEKLLFLYLNNCGRPCGELHIPIIRTSSKLTIEGLKSIGYTAYSKITHTRGVLTGPYFLDSKRSNECIDFNFGGSFRWQSEYPWCIVECIPGVGDWRTTVRIRTFENQNSGSCHDTIINLEDILHISCSPRVPDFKKLAKGKYMQYFTLNYLILNEVMNLPIDFTMISFQTNWEKNKNYAKTVFDKIDFFICLVLKNESLSWNTLTTYGVILLAVNNKCIKNLLLLHNSSFESENHDLLIFRHQKMYLATNSQAWLYD
ncbi:hypothetical protein AGLY_013274 [Aphis glycines]|uniref:Uncharacterized protein n=1 Tax=Aphis glycines TaxID=307491 RepID=A0A6G0T6G7_APHGL|nr:hypothetical protein AGLY_013274 [Aphis glycines]